MYGTVLLWPMRGYIKSTGHLLWKWALTLKASTRIRSEFLVPQLVFCRKPSGSVYAHVVGGWVSFVPQGSAVSVRLRHVSTGTSTSDGFVDYLALNAWRGLKMVGSQMAFRNPEASLSNQVYEYRISGASQQIRVWNVSDPVAPSIVPGTLSNSVYSFKVLGNQDNAFVAFNGNSYCTATAMGRVGNQNLHGVRDVDYLIRLNSAHGICF